MDRNLGLLELYCIPTQIKQYTIKFYWVRALLIVLVRCPVHTPVRTPTYGLPLSQSDERIRSVFQSVYNKDTNKLITINYQQFLLYSEREVLIYRSINDSVGYKMQCF